MPFVSNIEPYFKPTFEYLSTFYSPESYTPNSINLIGVLACLVFIIFAIVIHLIREFVDSQEELYRINLIKKRKMNDLIAQKQIEKEYIAEMKKYNRFVVLVNFKVQQIKSYLFDDNVDENELKNIKTNILTELFNSLDSQLISNKSLHKNESFFVIGNIENTPQCINHITSSILELSKKYSNLNITLSYDLSFDAISANSKLKEKLEFLEKIMQLNYHNTVLTTSLFKTCFEIISKSKLHFSEIGTFQFLIADKSQNYELFSVDITN